MLHHKPEVTSVWNQRRLVLATTALCAGVLASVASPSFATVNASGNNQWISIGIPTRNWLGTDGTYFLIGDDKGACSGVTPDYFRVDTGSAKWKEFYALILYAAANQKTFVCKVASGCGTTQIWIDYCEVPL